MRVVLISRFLLRLERLSDTEYELPSRGNKRRKHREAAVEECVSYSHTRASLHEAGTCKPLEAALLAPNRSNSTLPVC